MSRNPDPEGFSLDPDVHRLIFERDIAGDLFESVTPAEDPVAVVFGGQPGSGKSPTLDLAVRELEYHGGAVEIIGDDLRSFHPSYAFLMERDDQMAAFYTDRDTGRWVEMAIIEAARRRVNVVIEGTMRNSDKVAETMGRFRAAGYAVDARVLAVSFHLSEQGILQRYEAQKADRGVGRMTTPEAHRAAYAGLPVTLERIEREGLADRVTLYRRGGEVIYTNELQNGRWVRPPVARAILEAERDRAMDMQERRDYVRGYERLAAMLAKPERKASLADRENVDLLLRTARAKLAAEVFRREPQEKALLWHPELTDAYQQLRVLEGRTRTDGFPDKQRAVVVDCLRERIAAQIERCGTVTPGGQDSRRTPLVPTSRGPER